MESLRDMVGAALKMSGDELKTSLPVVADALKGNVGMVMEAVPDLLQKVMGKITEIDVVKFLGEAPEASEKLLDVLFEGAGIGVERDLEIKKELQEAGEVSVNFAATDSPLKGHLRISGGGLSGGGALLEKADLKITGPTIVIVGLLTGATDPIKGALTRQFRADGPVSVGLKLAPAMVKISKIFRSERRVIYLPQEFPR